MKATPQEVYGMFYDWVRWSLALECLAIPSAGFPNFFSSQFHGLFFPGFLLPPSMTSALSKKNLFLLHFLLIFVLVLSQLPLCILIHILKS